MQWLKRLPSFSGLFISINSLVANLGMLRTRTCSRLSHESSWRSIEALNVPVKDLVGSNGTRKMATGPGGGLRRSGDLYRLQFTVPAGIPRRYWQREGGNRFQRWQLAGAAAVGRRCRL